MFLNNTKNTFLPVDISNKFEIDDFQRTLFAVYWKKIDRNYTGQKISIDSRCFVGVRVALIILIDMYTIIINNYINYIQKREARYK